MTKIRIAMVALFIGLFGVGVLVMGFNEEARIVSVVKIASPAGAMHVQVLHHPNEIRTFWLPCVITKTWRQEGTLVSNTTYFSRWGFYSSVPVTATMEQAKLWQQYFG